MPFAMRHLDPQATTWMQAALSQARLALPISSPNPPVGCVIVRDGRLIGQGHTQQAGGPHAAGIVVDELPADHPDAIAAREIKIGFLSRMVRQRPWVRLKVAASLDGRTALDNGVSQWITSPAAREDGQHWRARASAVVTGTGTVL